MRQSSEAFMNEMLKDNSPGPQTDLSDRIADIIDKKMSEAMEKFQKEAAKVNPPEAEEPTVETPKENLDQEELEETTDTEEKEKEENE